MRNWLRGAAALSAVFALGHTMGHLQQGKATGIAGGVVTAMQQVPIDLFGAQRTYWDLFIGYSALAIVAAVLIAVLYWLAARLDPADARPFGVALASAQIAIAAIAFRNFFWAPALFNALAAALAIVAATRGRALEPG